MTAKLATFRPENRLEILRAAVSAAAAELPLVVAGGSVTAITATSCTVSGLGPFVSLGECIDIETTAGPQLAEVIRIDRNYVTVKPFATTTVAGLGALAWHRGALKMHPHPAWKGRVIDALGEPLDGAGLLPKGDRQARLDRIPPNPLHRQRVKAPLRTGVRIVDFFTPLCLGQRMGIFAGSGVGKSTLLSMLTRSLDFDTVVVALVGERGREVREFLEEMLAQSRDRTIAVVSTGDQSPMMRRMAPRTAMTVAEYFRDRGENVLLIVDSVTRFAHATREVSLAAGEPPVARGYTPSVFSELTQLLERAGPGEEGSGSITGIFSVLVDGDDHNDPIADSIRGTLDGHIVLDRAIADQGRYPAVNMLSSISRLAPNVWTADQRELVLKMRAMISLYEETRDLRLMGGYRPGSDAELDKTVAVVPRLNELMKQSLQSAVSDDAFQEIAAGLRQ